MVEKAEAGTVRTDNFETDYFRFGRGKDAFVILPGLSVQSVMLFADAVADAYSVLADDYTVYLFDRRKEVPGDGEDASVSYDIYDMARDTEEAMDALGLKDAALFGASQGGMIAMVIAAERPDLVSDLVLCSTSACLKGHYPETFEKWTALAKVGDAEGLYLSFGGAVYPESLFEQWKGALTDAAKTVTKEDLDRFAILTEGMRDFDFMEDLEEIKCPVLLVGSEDDHVLGAEATRKIAERLEARTAAGQQYGETDIGSQNGRPDFVLHMYDGYGHASYDTAPDFKERILKFLKDRD